MAAGMDGRFLIRLIFVLLLPALFGVVLADEEFDTLSSWRPDGRVHFRAQGLPNPTQTGVAVEAQRAVLREFLNRHPNVDIEAFAMPSVGGATTLDSGPLMAISAGIPPHAIYVNFRQSSTYIEQGFLDPLEILLARLLSDNEATRQWDAQGNWLADPTEEEIERALAAIRARTTDSVWPVVYREDEGPGNTGKHVWALPQTTVVMALLYRRDLFFEAGLDPDRPPRTWDELLEYARALRVPERQQYGMLFQPGHEISWFAYSFIVSEGGRAVRRKPDGDWEAAFNTPGTAEALYFFWRLIREPFERDGRIIDGAAGLSTGNRNLEWDRGKIGMQFGYLDDEMLNAINPQLVGIAPVPVGPSGIRGSEINARMLGVFSGSTPEQKLTVMQYLWFISSEEAQRIRTRVFVENGYGIFVNPILLERFGYDRILRRVPEGWRQAFDVAVQGGVPEPYGRNTQNIYRWMSIPINQCLEEDFNGMSREKVLEKISSYLDETVAEVNRRVLGSVPADQMVIRRAVGTFALILIGLAFAFGAVHIWRYFSAFSPPVQIRSNWVKYSWGYALLLPGFLLVLMWSYLPLSAGGFSIAFMDYRVVLESTWVGVDNFANALFDDRYWSALLRTFYFVALVIGLGFWPPILLAILLQEVPTATAKYAYRTVFYLPSILIGIVVMFLWKQLYSPSSDGVLNKLLLSLNALDPVMATAIKLALFGAWVLLVLLLIWLPVRLSELHPALRIGIGAIGVAFIGLTVWPVISAYLSEGSQGALAVVSSLGGQFHIEPLRWLQSPELAMLCVVIPSVWAGSGPGCIIYLAALKSVPVELYEAAEIDGAGIWHKIFYIVLPRLKYLIVIQFIAAVVGAFRGGEEFILVMTGGGPGNATTILSLEIFFRTFMDLNFGIGTAMAWLMGALLIGFTAYQLKILSRAEFRAGG